MRDHSSDSRCAFCPSDARSAKSSSYRWRWSIASPEDSTAGEAGSCSQSHQSLLWLPPSTWCAAVLLPHRKVLGKLDMGFLSGPARAGGTGRSCRRCVRRRQQGSGGLLGVPGSVVAWSSEGVEPGGWGEPGQSVGDVDFPAAVVDQGVVVAAEQHAVLEAGLAVVGPVADVGDLAAAGGGGGGGGGP